jgi:uncharacterized cupredoxin-like copper-binding protein
MLKQAMLNRSFRSCLMLLASLVCGHAAAATATVNALLQDPTTGSNVRSDRIVLDHPSAPAGKVTFHAVNQSKELVHELLVVQSTPGKALPYDQAKSEVAESRTHVLGEIDDLRPGASGAMTLELKPGSYILICNQPGHYKAGMKTKFSVTRQP